MITSGNRLVPYRSFATSELVSVESSLSVVGATIELLAIFSVSHETLSLTVIVGSSRLIGCRLLIRSLIAALLSCSAGLTSGAARSG